jgi:hypothetical protein
MLYRLRKRFEGGLKASWYRERVRPKILQTPSLLLPQMSDYEIHVLTSIHDWLNLIWALKSFLHFSHTRTALCIHEDGSLTPEVRDILATHFVGARIVSRAQADEEVLPSLAEFPQCQRFRSENNLALKVFDLRHYAQASRVLLLDSDVLTFRKPEVLLASLNDASTPNRFNRDLADAYTADRSALADEFGLDVASRFNSGVCTIQLESLKLDWIEQFLSSDLLDGHFWRIEQTVLCLCSSRFGCKPLPEPYDVVLSDGVQGKPLKHYIGAIRQRMYAEGIRHLLRQNFLQQLMVAERPVPSESPS